MLKKTYRRIMLGRQSAFADECYKNGWVGGDWGFKDDLTGAFDDDYRKFGESFRPVYLANHPEKTKIAAGLACGMLWSICHGMRIGDVILSPDGERGYYVGECTSDYYFVAGEPLPHRRRVNWFPQRIATDDMSEVLRNSTGSRGTVADISIHAEEIDRLINNDNKLRLIANNDVIEDPSTFALEKHLEDFLVSNWKQTELGKKYDIFSDEGELVGQQFPSDTGPIDILAVSKNRKELLVVELKRGRASDAVVGQILRYMGYVSSDLAEDGQVVRGAIIALDDDLRLRRALSVTNNIDFYRYKISFKLEQT